MFSKWNRCWNRPSMGCGCGCSNPCEPIVEPAICNCVEKECHQEVNHVCPVHTHQINKVFIHHNYTPQYSCSEETQVIDLGNQCGCNQFGRCNGCDQQNML